MKQGKRGSRNHFLKLLLTQVAGILTAETSFVYISPYPLMVLPSVAFSRDPAEGKICCEMAQL